MNYPLLILLFVNFITIITVIYCWFINLLLFSKILRKDNYKEYYKPVSIIIPCYNEDPTLLKECVESCINSDGKHQIILINNNSSNADCLKMIDFFRKDRQILVLDEKKQGKRFAHSKGLKYAKYDIIVFIDSDTIVKNDSILNLIKPLQNKNIGACCGHIQIKNDKRFFTKCLDTMYWNSFEFYRYATSSLGYLYVCSGALAAYRKDLLLKLESEYLNQKFFGRPCSISDDTFMTVRIQSRFGMKIAYCSNAIAYTYSPETFNGFWKQLVRWRQGFLRESIQMWREPKKNIKFLFIDAQFNLLVQTAIVFLRFLFFISLILNFSVLNLISYLLFFIISSILLSAYQIICRPKKILYILTYSFIYNFFFVFTLIHAYIKIGDQGKWLK